MIKKERKEKEENSFEKIPKLVINKKIMTKEDFMKSKNLFEKINSARLANIEIHKLNLNFTNEIKSEIKTLIFWRFEKKYIPSQQTNEIK